jgi:hypothetical protein
MTAQTRLCYAMKQSLLEQADQELKGEVPSATVAAIFLGLAQAFNDAAELLQRQDHARLGIVGAIPADLPLEGV